MKINIESSPPEIWIKIRFLEINGSPSLLKTYEDKRNKTLRYCFFLLYINAFKDEQATK